MFAEKCKNPLHEAAIILSWKMRLAVGNSISFTHAHEARYFTSTKNTRQCLTKESNKAPCTTVKVCGTLLGVLQLCGISADTAPPRTRMSWPTLFASRTRRGEEHFGPSP